MISGMIPSLLKKGLLELKKKKQSFSLIDLGCGSGDLLYCLKKDGYLKKVKIFGLDIDKKAISIFKKKLPEAKAILVDALNSKILRTGSFDFVICNQVIEHVENDKVLVEKVNRILKKGAILYISSVLKKWYGLYWHRNKFGQIVIDPNHLREYASPKEFSNLLTKKGFEIKNLNVCSARFPLVDYFLLFLAKLGILRLTNLRDYYLAHPRIYQLSKRMLFLPNPGYATIEVLAEKKRNPAVAYLDHPRGGQNRQPLSAKLGEVRFRKKLVKQHQGKKVFYPTHLSATENLQLLKQRSENSLRIFKKLKKNNVPLSPFMELGGEKCERASVLTSKMNCQGLVVDLSAESLESAESFCPQIGLKKLPIRICADVYHLPFADNSFAFAFAFQTLHHFPDPKPIMAEIYRVLTPGGYFYFDEEPIKQLVNFAFWRRDFHLRWWEKILKALLILPFISQIGKSEVSEGVLEETFDLATWEKALNQFDEANAELIPYPFGPRTKIKKSKRDWLRPRFQTKLLINLLGGGIKALCQKKGKCKKTNQDISIFLICTECQGKMKKVNNFLRCLRCQQKYPVKNKVLYLLPKTLMKKLYP